MHLGNPFLRPATPWLLASLLFAPTAIAQIHPGSLVVLRLGDGVAPLSSAAQAVFLDEYTTTGILLQSIALPTAASGLNLPMTNSGSATSEGHLNLSADGLYLVAAGYGASPGTASVAGTASATTPRVIARIGLDEVVDTTTSITNALSGNNIRSATSSNGVDFWAVGANSGIQYLTLGSSTSIALNTTNPLNNRTVTTFGGQLYCSGGAQGFYGVSAVGTGLPTTAGQTVTLLPGFPTASGPSPYDHFFADANTLYVADDRTGAAGGGIQKWTLNAGTWSLQYTLAVNPGAGCRGLCGSVQGGVATLFATTSGPVSQNEIVTVTDTGAASTFTSIAVAGTNTVFRGIRQTPAAGGIVRLPHGCGPTTILSTGTGSLGTTVTTTLGNTVGVPFLGLGILVGGTPFCGTCTIGHEWAAALFGAVNVFQIPSDPGFVGLSVGVQGADLLGVGGCGDPLVTLTDTMVFTIH